jgi:transcription termination factor Rho
MVSIGMTRGSRACAGGALLTAEISSLASAALRAALSRLTTISPPLKAAIPMTDEVQALEGLTQLTLQQLKAKTPAELLAFAEQLEVENANSLRTQDMMFAILKQLAERGVEIGGGGVIEILPDGFGFLRSPQSNYLPGPDDIYVSPNQIRRFGVRGGDTVDGQIRAPKDGERYFALVKVNTVNFEDPEKVRHKVHFDNLTPLYPDRAFKMELDDPSGR